MLKPADPISLFIKSLLVFAWLSIIGSIADGLIALYGIWLIAVEQLFHWSVSVDTFLRDGLPLLYWVKRVAELVLPEVFVEWLFALPALVYFPVRILLSLILSIIAFAVVRRLRMHITGRSGQGC